MGTKIEHAIDPLATSTNSNNCFTLQYPVDDWNYLQAIKSKKFQKTDHNNFSDSMDRMLEKHNMECIKKTMQVQEEIFKHQVQELHRLYSVQKRLMGELKKESKQDSRIWSSSEMNHSQFINKRNMNHATTTQTNSGYIFHFQNVIDDARERRSGSCTSGETIMKMARAGAIDLERPAAALEDNNISTAVSAIHEEHVHAAGPSNKMSTDDDTEDSDVELTLSIGVSSSSSSSKNKKKSKGYQLGCLDNSFKSDRGEDSSSPNTPISSSSATFDQEKKMPNWLFGLSINKS